VNSNLTDQAVHVLTEQHWPLIPVRATKKPCLDSWKEFQQHLPTADQVREWARRFGPSAWAVITGATAGIVVVDFDGASGCGLMRTWGLDPHIRTGSGGFHVYFKHPGWRVPTLNAKACRNGWPWPGVDVRGDGGYAVMLGRNLKGPYLPLRELQPELFNQLPSELRHFLREHRAEDSSPPAAVPSGSAVDLPADSRVAPDCLIDRALQMAAQSGRNNAGFWLAVQLRDNLYSETGAASVMEQYRTRVGRTNTRGVREPYTQAEAAASLRQAFSRPAREPWIRGRSLSSARTAAARRSRQ
jgi:hypothetical protein